MRTFSRSSYVHIRITYLGMCVNSRNMDQKLVNLLFFEDRIFYGLLVGVALKMYNKVGLPKWSLVGQMLKLIGK